LCAKSFSNASFDSRFLQKKRHKNHLVKKLLCSGVSQRRAAQILKLNRKTVVRKMVFLSLQARFELGIRNIRTEKAKVIEFDDMVTFEHTKCKPLSITLAVEASS